MADLQTILSSNDLNHQRSVYPSTSGYGLKVDHSSPVWGWKDLTGQIIPRSGGAAAPAFTPFHGSNVKVYSGNAGDKIDNITFHIPHDYVPNTDMYIHIHWGHNGTAISGTFSGNYHAIYSKGYTQAGEIFESELTIPWTTGAIADVIEVPRWSHNITELAITNAGGDTTHFDRADIETDGLMMISWTIGTTPTISGSDESNLPYIFMIDLHYQSNQLATKGRNTPFYD